MRKILLVLGFLLVGCEMPLESSDVVVDTIPNQAWSDRCEWVDLNRVIDGDTIVVGRNQKVRLIGIDTPEIAGPYTDEESYGEEASQQAKDWLSGENEVCLVTDRMGDKFDKYNRRLAYVYREDGFHINAEMVKAGMAKVYRKFPFEFKEEFLRHEEQAKLGWKGVWN